ncbi:MAG: hypothetical protein R3E66_19120 [bacterium]
MAESAPQKFEIQCPACASRFRLTSKSGNPPSGTIPCPKCKTPIDTSVGQPWQSIGISSVFGRETPAAPTKRPKVFTDVTTLGEQTRPIEEPPAPRAARFNFTPIGGDVPEQPPAPPVQEPVAPGGFARRASQTDVPPLVATEPEMPAPAAELPKPAALPEALATPPKDIAPEPIERAEAHPKAPTPEPSDPKPKDAPAPKISRSALRTRLQRLPPLSGPKPSGPEPSEPKPPARKPEPVDEPPASADVTRETRIRATMFSEEMLDAGIELRTQDATFSKMTLAAIARVLQRGAWPGAIEVLDPSGRWMPLPLHPVFARVEEELASQTQAALRVVSAEVERHSAHAAKTVEVLITPDPVEPRPVPPSIPASPDVALGTADSPDEPVTFARLPDASVPPAVPRLPDTTPDRSEESPSPRSPDATQEPTSPDAPLATNPGISSLPEPLDGPDSSSLPSDLFEVGPKQSSLPLIPIAIGLMATAAAAYLLAPHLIGEPKPVDTPPSPPPVESIQAATLVETRAAGIAAAVASLRAQTTEQLAQQVDALIARKNYGDAWELISELRVREPGNKSWALREIEISLGSQEWSEARVQAIAAMTRFEDETLDALYMRAVNNDARLTQKTITLSKASDFDTIRALGGGRSVSLKMKRGDQTVYAFKPAQAEWGDGWRAEVAAWRLCELVPCGFMVPWSRPSRISREDLDAMYPMDTEKQRTYAQRFPELTWVLEPGPDGIEREYLYGVLKTWVPHFADWPIEYTHLWEPWLGVEEPPDLDQPLGANIRGMMLYKNGEYYRNILREDDGTTTRSVARELSNVLVFDYLTNNWDRFSVQEPYFGVNNQFANGHFVSIDNGAAFHIQVSSRVDARFEPVTRFSRTMIEGLRHLQPSWVNPILFSDPNDLEKQRLEIFWQRRDAVLGRVTELVEQHGDKNVLYFD